MRFGLFVITLLAAAGSAFGQQASAGAPDAIFYNGKVVTVDSGFSIQQAFAVKGDQFVDVGTTTQIRALAGKNTRLVDLKGSTVIPGLTDSHDHLYAVAKVMRGGVDMVGVATTAQLLERIKAAVAKAKRRRTHLHNRGLEYRCFAHAERTRCGHRRRSCFLGPPPPGARHVEHTAAYKLAGVTQDNENVCWAYYPARRQREYHRRRSSISREHYAHG